MEALKIDINKYKKKESKITNERQLIIGEFTDKLNSERKGFPQLKPARIGMMLRYLDTSHLKTFFGECKYSDNFSKHFWWCFKNKKNEYE